MKNGKSSAEDQIVNEYLKHSFNTISDIYDKLSNIIFDSGIIPEQWLLGNIPVNKNKESKVDPNCLDQFLLLTVLATRLNIFLVTSV